MKRWLFIGSVIFVEVFLAGDLFSATYDLTGNWNYTLSENWAVGGFQCNPGPDASGTCTIEQTGDTFTFAYTSGVVCDPSESCTFEGSVNSAVNTCSTTDIVDDEGGSVTSTIVFTASSATSASGLGNSKYTHPSGLWECEWGSKITLTKADDGVQLTKYSLMVNKIGIGTVILDPAGGIYDSGTIVQLTAVGDPGWRFYNWAGDVNSPDSTSTTVIMDSDKTVTATFLESNAEDTIDGGYNVTNELWAKSVLQVSGSPVTLVWKMVGADITPSGDQVISGYFYADPNDFAYGSVYNPEVFVKIYVAKNGWCNIAYNHVTVDDVMVDSAHNYAGTPTKTGLTSLANRLDEHQYYNVAIDNSLQSSGGGSSFSSSNGYFLASDLWAKTTLQPASGPVNLIWKEVGTDTTLSGDTVVSGYFYASPDEFPYGSEYNPEVFVKVYIAANGWANMAFNHVTVDGVEVLSSLNFSGLADQSGTATLEGRLVEHQYTGISLQ